MGEKARIELLNGQVYFWVGKVPIRQDAKLQVPREHIGKYVEDLKFETSGNNKYVKSYSFEGKVYAATAVKGPVTSAPPRTQVETRNVRPPANPAPGRIPAKAPYNFVPLNGVVVESDAEQREMDNYFEGRHTGHIDLSIETLTPMFIRTTKESEHSFSIGGRFAVPGSTLRGMARTLVEICGYGKLRFFNNRPLSHRGMADLSPLRKAYTDVIEADRGGENANGGYLKYDPDTRSYCLMIASWVRHEGGVGGITGAFIRTDGACTVNTGYIQGKLRNWVVGPPTTKDLEISDDALSAYEEDRTRDKKVVNVMKLAKETAWIEHGGYPVFYQLNKYGKVGSFGHTPNYRIPYMSDDFLNVGSIGSHVPQNPIAGLDFAASIFGHIEKAKEDNEAKIQPGRVFFEDCMLQEPKADDVLGRYITQKLMEPKPTTFQHYLEQEKRQPTYSLRVDELRHWADDPKLYKIRGFKMYWHRRTNAEGDGYPWALNKLHPDAKFTHQEGTDQYPIRPIKPKRTFQGRIRFENLTEAELGALLFVLDLPEGCHHKIGLGKPLGLGSVKVKPSLVLREAGNKRYDKLFEENGWNTGELQEPELERFKKAFAEVVVKAIEPSIVVENSDALWARKRLQELKALLTWEQEGIEEAEWLERTRPLEIRRPLFLRNGENYLDNNNRHKTGNEYKKRFVLPRPTEVADNQTSFRDSKTLNEDV